MSVSVMFPPETIWGYDLMTSAYSEKTAESWQRIVDHVKKLYLDSTESALNG